MITQETKAPRRSLASTPVTDLSPLVSLANLRELDLQDSRVTDVTPLLRMKGLSKVNVRDTGLSRAQSEILLKRLPNAEISR